ncbi:MAG: DUF4190 domain-containing protein [Nanoarchaeales archaeon]|nr:DUF4190 domain-containing protein [Nanoarchaeales archaeon]
MEKIQIKNYLLKHKDSHSLDSLKTQLISYGALAGDVDEVITKINLSSNLNSNIPAPTGPTSNSNDDYGLAFGLSIAGLIIPLVGLILSIFAIKFAKRSRLKNPNNGLAKAALILGWINVVIYSIIFILFIFNFILAYFFFSYQVQAMEQIEMKTSSNGPALSIERVQEDSIYILNRGSSDVSVDKLLMSLSGNSYSCISENFVVVTGVVSYPCESTGTYLKGEKITVLIESSSGLISSEYITK